MGRSFKIVGANPKVGAVSPICGASINGGLSRIPFCSDTVDKMARFVTLPSVVSAVCIAQN